ncbi:MAG: outer membrane beta-barrel protein [Bacteroidales bacterium]|nr:outer membrane beta-barrel protein [Bacteroidales bacterium]
MKKLFTVIAVALFGAAMLNAQSFGVIGGFTSSNTGIDTKDAMANLKNVSLYHVGAAVRWEFGDIFALQPQLAYQVKGSNLSQSIDNGSAQDDITNAFQSKTGYVELSAGLQAGLDLLVFRPFVLVEPFVGYAVTGNENFDQMGQSIASGTANREEIDATMNGIKNKLEYGFGVGGGVHVLDHFQVTVQWFMNLGNLYNNNQIDAAQIEESIKSSYKDIKNYQGIKVTLGLFF